MKKQLIALVAVGLASFLAVPSVVFGDGRDSCEPIVTEGMSEDDIMAAKADAMGSSECMGYRLGSVEQFSHGHGVSLYGSFRGGVSFGSGDTNVVNLGSRWGIQGSGEVAEGLTAAFKYEGHMDITSAEFGGGNDEILASASDTPAGDIPLETVIDEDVAAGAADNRKTVSAGGVGGRLSYVNLAGGFGTIQIGQMWAASGNHYGAAIYPSAATFEGSYGGSSGRQGNTISYSSSAGDVSFQIDKVTGTGEKIDFGASAALGPVGIGYGYWKNKNDDASFSGVAVSAGAAGVTLVVGLGSEDSDTGESTDTSSISINGALGDSGVSYGVQVLNSDVDTEDTNYVFLKNSLGTGASLILEHVDPKEDDAITYLGLKVDF